MILLSDDIKKNQEDGKIHIAPFWPEQLQPNSYDVTLDDKLEVYEFEDETELGVKYLDMKKPLKTKPIIIPKEGMILKPGELYLGSTVEEIGSDHFVPMYEGRSSIGRLSISSHQSAGFGDIGFKKRWTLEIAVIVPVKIYPNIRIGQVFFHTPLSTPDNKRLYNGKYASQSGISASKLHEDFKKA